MIQVSGWKSFMLTCTEDEFKAGCPAWDTSLFPFAANYQCPVLHMAVLTSRYDIGTYLLHSKYPINALDSQGYTAIEVAERIQNLVFMNLLLLKKPNLMNQDYKGVIEFNVKKLPLLNLTAYACDSFETYQLLESHTDNIGEKILYIKYLAYRFSIKGHYSSGGLKVQLEFHYPKYIQPKFIQQVNKYFSQENYFPSNWDHSLDNRITSVLDDQDPTVRIKVINFNSHTFCIAYSNKHFIHLERQGGAFVLYDSDPQNLPTALAKIDSKTEYIDYFKREIFSDLNLRNPLIIPTSKIKGNFCTWGNLKPLIEGITLLVLLEAGISKKISLVYGRAIRKNFSLFDKANGIEEMRSMSNSIFYTEANIKYMKTAASVGEYNRLVNLPPIKTT